MASKLLSDRLGTDFAMVPVGVAGPALDAYRAGWLQARDFSVLWALLMNMNWRNGRTEMSASELAAFLGHDRINHVLHSVARLRKAGVIARGTAKTAGGRRFFCFHPDVALSGGPYRRSLQIDAYFEAADLDRQEWLQHKDQRVQEWKQHRKQQAEEWRRQHPPESWRLES
jgi:hypothetical protein